MMPSGRASVPKWPWQWLVLCIITQLQLEFANAQTAVQTLFVTDTDTIASFNVPPDSDDINFYLLTPDWYQYTAIGFGATMSNALMLVMYPSADRKSVTVSPRRAMGNTEPVYSSETEIILHDTSMDDNSNMVINATCRRCLPFAKTGSVAAMMFAVGPDLDLNSDDLDARIRRHVAYGSFTIDILKATGPGGIGAGISGGNSSDATLSTDGSGALLVEDNDRTAMTHGILYAVVTLAVAPFDSLVAGALGARWAWTHGITATVYFAFVIGAMVPGVLISREHVATQQFRTGHQVLGLLAIVAMTIMFVWGIALSWIRRSAKQRGQEPPETARVLGAIHRWVSRLIWVLLLINVGLGLKLSEQRPVLIYAYLAVALGLVVILIPIFFCIWRCSKRRKEKEEGLIEMPTIYDHNYQQFGMDHRQ